MSFPTLDVQSKEFQDAFKRYMRVTSRDMATALNGKLRDTMFLAAKFGPFNNAEFSKADYDRNRSPAYITFKTVKQYGENPPGVSRERRTLASGKTAKRKGSYLAPGQKWGMTQRNRKARSLRKRHNGMRGYMSSAFIKAGLRFAPAASKVGKPKQKYFGGLTGGECYFATPQKLASLAVTHWSAKSAHDASAKQRLAEGGIRAGLRNVTRDMEKYMAEKMIRTASEVSAK